MIIINIRIRPWGDETLEEDLGILKIVNDGTGDYKTGNYRVSFEDLSGASTRIKSNINWKSKGVERGRHILHFIYTILKKGIEEDNNG